MAFLLFMMNYKNKFACATSVRQGLRALPLGNYQLNSKIFHSFRFFCLFSAQCRNSRIPFTEGCRDLEIPPTEKLSAL